MEAFAARRQHLIEQIGQHALVILLGGHEVIRNGDSCFPFRQNSDFFYLTGFCEPDAMAILAPGHSEGEFILFNRPYDSELSVWSGELAGQEGAVQQFGADNAYSIHEFWDILPRFLTEYQTVIAPFGSCASFDTSFFPLIHQLKNQKRRDRRVPNRFQDLAPYTGAMRVIKSPSEINAIREAVSISTEAHLRCLEESRVGMAEYELDAILMNTFYRHGSRASAYSSIVAAGKNSCTLHYVANNQMIQAGDLVLIDAGAEFDYYASDITRTFPINPCFSGPQKAIYECVLLAQEAAIRCLKPGIPWDSIQKTVVENLTHGLCDLGLLKGAVADNIAEGHYKRFYMHSAGHYLGLDVHDVGDYSEQNTSRPLAPGMVFTVEPGLYIRPDSDIDPCWWNLGIRIEDDILITSDGYEVLSSVLPKQIDDIEAIRRNP